MAQVNKSPEKDQPTTLATLPAVDEPVTTVPQVMNATGQKTKIDAKNQWVTAEFDAPSGSSSGVAASGIVMFNFHNIPPLTRVDATFDYAKNNVKLEVAKRAQPFGMKARTEPVLVSFAAEGMESAHFEITAQNIRTVVLKAVDVSNGYGESWPDFQKYLDRPLFTYSLSQKDADPKTLVMAILCHSCLD